MKVAGAPAVTGSLSFDQAADFYDATRDLDPAARRHLTDILERELAGRGCIEVGIGTGLVGLELARRGILVCGVDLSARMLEKLVQKFQRPAEIKLVRANATVLPFADDSFDAALTSQMLHLIDNWRNALSELARVVRPGGLVLIDLGNDPDSGWGGPWAEVAKRFWKYACPQGRRQPEVWKAGVVQDEMKRLGFDARRLDKVEAFETLSLNDVISRLERKLWSACWSLPGEEVADAADRTRAWAGRTYGDLESRHRICRTISYWACEHLPTATGSAATPRPG